MPIEPNKPEITTSQVDLARARLISFLNTLQERQLKQKNEVNLLLRKEESAEPKDKWELPLPSVVTDWQNFLGPFLVSIEEHQKNQAKQLDDLFISASQTLSLSSVSVSISVAPRPTLQDPPGVRDKKRARYLNSLVEVQRYHQLKIDALLLEREKANNSILRQVVFMRQNEQAMRQKEQAMRQNEQAIRERDKANRVVLNLRNTASASATLPVTSGTLPVNSGPSSAASNSSSGQKIFQPELAMRAIQKANRAVSNTTPIQKIYQPDGNMNLRIRDLSSEIQDLKRSKSLQSIQISNLLSHNKSIVKHQQFLTTQVDSLLKAQADLKKQNEGLQKAILSLVSSQEISDSNIDQLRKNQLSIHSVTEKNQDNLEEVREVLWPFLSGSSNSDPESVASGLSSASSGLFGVPRPGSSASILREQDQRVEQSRKRKRSSGQSSDQQLDARF